MSRHANDIIQLHGPQMLVDKTNFGLVIYNHAKIYRFEETSSQSNEYQFFSAFHWSTSDAPPAPQCITVQLPISKTLGGPCIVAIVSLNAHFT